MLNPEWGTPTQVFGGRGSLATTARELGWTVPDECPLWVKSSHWQPRDECPLLTQSGHSPLYCAMVEFQRESRLRRGRLLRTKRGGLKSLKVSAVVFLTAFVALGVAAFLTRPRPASTPPGPREAIITAEFNVSSAERAGHRVGLLEGLLFVTFLEAKALNPEGAAGTVLPTGAVIRGRPLPLGSYTAPGKKRICGGSVAQDTHHAYPARGPFFESDMYSPPKDLMRYDYYVATDQTWSARCWPEVGSCTAVFANGKWASRINIHQRDLCNAPLMNRRLVAIAGKWIR